MPKRGSLILPKSEYQLGPESDATRLPITAKKLYGCTNCEWRRGNLCPYNFKEGKGHPLKHNTHSRGICQERVDYLMSFTPPGKQLPTFAQWQLGFNKGIAQVQMLKEYQQLKSLEEELFNLEIKIRALKKELVSGKPNEELVEARQEFKDLTKRKQAARAEWFSIWKEVTILDDKQVQRETPTKMEVTHTQMSLQDIHTLMRKHHDVVDVDYEEIKEDGNEEKE